VSDYYEVNKESLVQLLTRSEDGLYDAMRQLVDFRCNFEDYVALIEV
jgi:hypothetical protein